MQIGNYQLLTEVGRGAMGVVYRARASLTGTDVAIKLLPRNKNEAQRERFRREAGALAKLEHPNVVGVLDYGEYKGASYMVLELVEGEGLDARLARSGPLQVGYALQLFVPLAEALAHAHERGILHRDIKPANVLLASTGRPYLADFGLAKDVDSHGVSLTQEGALVGTPGFWAPEQARGDRLQIGAGTDVYGLGATLYAALTGSPPIDGQTLAEMVVAVQHKVPKAPHVLRPDVPGDLSRICLRSLAKDPSQRYPSGREFAEALSGCLVRTTGRSGASGGLLALGAALALALAGVGGVRWALATSAAGAENPKEVVPPSIDETPKGDTLFKEGVSRLVVEDAQGARASFLAMLELDPQDGRAMLGLGDVYLHLRDFPTALDWLNRGLELRPQDGRGHLARGLVFANQDKPRLALRDFESAVALEPKNPRAHYNLGVLLAKMGEHRSSAEAYTRAIEIYGSNPEAGSSFLNRSISRVKLRDYEGSESDARRAAELEPSRFVAHYYLGLALSRQARWAEAVDSLEHALALAPEGDTQVGEIQEQLDRARANLPR